MTEDDGRPSRRDSSDEDALSSSLSNLVDGLSSERSASGSAADERSGSLSELAESLRKRRERGSKSAPDAGSERSEWDLLSEAGDDVPGTDPKTEAVLELIGDASNILLCGPADCAAEQSLCSRTTASASGESINLLVVTVGRTPGERLSILQNYLSNAVANTVVVDVQTYDADPTSAEYDGPVEILTVQDATDLRRIGILTSNVLSDWADSPAQTAVCFHSVSDLLANAEDQQLVFRFLHVLRGRVRSADARAHYHLHPERHEEQVVRTFTSLFDAVLRFDADGSVSLD